MSEFVFAGVKVVDMAREYGTPLYLMDEGLIRSRCREIKEKFLNRYENTMALYASKAFLTRDMARIIKEEGLGADVVSGGELYLLKSVDFPMDKVFFHGNNKSLEELEMALNYGASRIVVDSISELKLLNDLACKMNKKPSILLRISPGVETDTHEYIQTGQLDSKFGIPLKEDLLKETFDLLDLMDNIDFKGIHFHVGSQLFDNSSHLKSLDLIMDLIKRLDDERSLKVYELNVGGGFAIKYIDEEPKSLEYFTDEIYKRLESLVSDYGLIMPKLIIEPGRWIVGESGITVYEVGAIKEIPGVRKYVSVDGGMADNIRTSLYGASYKALLANKYGEKEEEIVTIAGKCCESGDILVWDAPLPKVEEGDYLVVLSTGAYNYSMASNYNMLRRPALVMAQDGRHRLSVRRETYEDLIRREL